MDKEQAVDLIRQTFPKAFDKTRFHNFAVNVLNHLDESKAQHWSNQYVKDAFKGHVQRYERLGTYTSPDKEKLDVLVVHLTNDSKLERARTAIRNFVADHLKTRDEKDAALVAFVSPTEKQWRFSYVKMEYSTVEKESGKVGVEARLTPARRFSYIVGEGESCHTAQTRFLDLLRDTDTDPALADIEEAFSVEAVTDEFFKKYRSLFEEFETEVKKLITKDSALRDEFKRKVLTQQTLLRNSWGKSCSFIFSRRKGGWALIEARNGVPARMTSCDNWPTGNTEAMITSFTTFWSHSFTTPWLRTVDMMPGTVGSDAESPFSTADYSNLWAITTGRRQTSFSRTNCSLTLILLKKG
ncbi:MAG: hypothetical protein ABSF91_04620 [Bacteroidota bacterium]|jgi:hypothetical protein